MERKLIERDIPIRSESSSVVDLCPPVKPKTPIAGSPENNDLLDESLRLVTLALDLLDQDGTVPSIGAHLDLARVRLADHIAGAQTA